MLTGSDRPTWSFGIAYGLVTLLWGHARVLLSRAPVRRTASDTLACAMPAPVRLRPPSRRRRRAHVSRNSRTCPIRQLEGTSIPCLSAIVSSVSAEEPYIFSTGLRKDHVWICAEALFQGAPTEHHQRRETEEKSCRLCSSAQQDLSHLTEDSLGQLRPSEGNRSKARQWTILRHNDVDRCALRAGRA